MNSKKLILMCGLPGSGKSTYAKEKLSYDSVYCSRDEVRFRMVKENEDYFSKEKQVFKEWIKEIQNALDDETGPNYVIADATHISRASRAKTLSHLNLKNVFEVQVYWIDTPVEVCIERNEKRKGRERVPNEAIENMAKGFQRPSWYEKFIDNVFHV